LFQLPDLSPRVFDLLAMLARFNFVGCPFARFGLDVLGSLAGLFCLLTFTPASDLNPVAHHLADIVTSLFPRVAQFLARSLPGIAQLMINRATLLERSAHRLLRPFECLAHIVGGGILLLKRFVHLAHRPLKGPAKLLANRSEVLAELLDQVFRLILEPLSRIVTLIVVVVSDQASEKGTIHAGVERGAKVTVGLRVLGSVQLL